MYPEYFSILCDNLPFCIKNILKIMIIKKFKFFKSEDDFMLKAARTPRSNCVLETTKGEKASIGMRSVEEAMIDSICKMRQSVLS